MEYLVEYLAKHLCLTHEVVWPLDPALDGPRLKKSHMLSKDYQHSFVHCLQVSCNLQNTLNLVALKYPNFSFNPMKCPGIHYSLVQFCHEEGLLLCFELWKRKPLRQISETSGLKSWLDNIISNPLERCEKKHQLKSSLGCSTQSKLLRLMQHKHHNIYHEKKKKKTGSHS